MWKVRVALVAGVLAVSATPHAFAQNWQRIGTNLIGHQEVPSVSTAGTGQFDAVISPDASAILYELTYRDIEAPVTQAHIHFGQRSANGGISVFLCSNLGNGPAETQPCPATPATVTGRITAQDVIGPAGQGIAAGEFAELIRAIRAGSAYVNVHSTKFPGGEVRGQLDAGHSH